MTWVLLIVAVVLVIVSAFCRAIGYSPGNHAIASKGRVGVLVGAPGQPSPVPVSPG